MAHLLKTNNWMETHNFPDDTKVRRFCLTLIGEARLWYESLRPIDMDWDALQECFRQQYSKFGSSREQYIIACLYAKPHINNKEAKLRINPVWWMLVRLQLVNLLHLLCHNISLFITKICCHGNQLFKYKI